jgi:hypothetical protein
LLDIEPDRLDVVIKVMLQFLGISLFLIYRKKFLILSF